MLVNGKPAASTSGQTSAVITGLTNGTPYQVSVESTAAGGWPFSSKPTAAVTATPGSASGGGGSASAIAVSDYDACAIVSGGDVDCWGRKEVDEQPTVTVATAIGGITGATSISADQTGVCVVAAGNVECWEGDEEVPYRISGISTATRLLSDSGAGGCAILASGEVACWGCAGFCSNAREGTVIPGVTEAVAGAINDSYANACAVKLNGHVTCWEEVVGYKDVYEQPGVTDATAASEGSSQCFVLEDQRLSCDGQTAAEYEEDEPTIVKNVTDVRGVAITHANITSGTACAVLFSGTVQCWGDGLFGILGAGTFDSEGYVKSGPETCPNFSEGSAFVCSEEPIDVPGISNATEVSLGYWNGCALAGGEVLCWGTDAWGDLGDGKETNTTTPVRVIGLG